MTFSYFFVPIKIGMPLLYHLIPRTFIQPLSTCHKDVHSETSTTVPVAQESKINFQVPPDLKPY